MRTIVFLLLASALGAPDPRVRAARVMVGKLEETAHLLPKLRPEVVRGRCPTSIDWVTFGVTKADPWDVGFRLVCDDALPGGAGICSAGPDGKHQTRDDVCSWKPPVPVVEACSTVCARLDACRARDPLGAGPGCARWCAARTPRELAALWESTRAGSCAAVLDAALSAVRSGLHPPADCRRFGAHVAAVARRPAAAAKAARGCEEEGIVTRAEEDCALAARSIDEIQRCLFALPPSAWQP